ncbi:hypothetical protein IFM51744_02574 [Aspergillus udagawae]|nr:hypothetical protein IFM51744_02574 [Aspergillus udagawae]GFF97642.1 hypothetical protein IFM53868_09263 [Aspergillus udagawae]GFG18021.1 hypothetical protein IFM5058_08789 [Aspergillus udagawae]
MQKPDKVECAAELRARGKEIARDLENGINKLEIATRVSGKQSQTDWVSQFFAIAALVLCHSITSGPSLDSPAIQNTVGKALVMLRYKEKSISLTGSVWALCIVGCMVSPPDRPYFESLIVELVHASGGIGNTATVLKIMRKCWEMQQFDEADCRDAMSELEINALLI